MIKRTWNVIRTLLRWFVAGCGLLWVACGGSADPSTALQEATIADFLAGSSVRCMLDEECDTGACYQGRCAGVLTTDALWAQRQVGRRLVERIQENPEFGDKFIATLREALRDETRSATQRSRLIALFAVVDRTPDLQWLKGLGQTDEPLVHLRVREALANRGDLLAAQELSTIARGKSEPLAMFAVSAIGTVANGENVDLLAAIALGLECTHGARLAAVRHLSRWCIEERANDGDKPKWFFFAVDTLKKIIADTAVPYLHFDAMLGVEHLG